ncbi:class I SAM-dependent methyltransferase [Oceanospirillum maris]|uniref:class I SAM-dependent methyltransferase n=1 Tax=Oceanospirillum maris TaxID=64977 RepID=UPI0004198B7D|nr:class I SAM-dependent methyltransferase [Oceanospirillum maris]
MTDIAQHYQESPAQDCLDHALWQKITNSLTDASIDLSKLTADLLAPIDQLHIGGRKATQNLLQRAELPSQSHVLEIGAGLGGTARLIADQLKKQSNCHITAVDITSSFTFACQQINNLMNYQNIHSICGDACLPHVAAASQDVIISQHTLMNIPDKVSLLNTLFNSLKPNGKLLLHEVIAGDNLEALALPVPWASQPEHSDLPQQQALIALLEQAGFTLASIHNVSEDALAWRNKHTQREAGQSDQGKTQQKSPLNPKLIFGERFIQMGKNVMANLATDKVRVVEAIFIKK